MKNCKTFRQSWTFLHGYLPHFLILSRLKIDRNSKFSFFILVKATHAKPIQEESQDTRPTQTKEIRLSDLFAFHPYFGTRTKRSPGFSLDDPESPQKKGDES